MNTFWAFKIAKENKPDGPVRLQVLGALLIIAGVIGVLALAVHLGIPING